MPDPDKIMLLVQDSHIGEGEQTMLDRATRIHQQMEAYMAAAPLGTEGMVIVPMGDLLCIDIETFGPDAMYPDGTMMDFKLSDAEMSRLINSPYRTRREQIMDEIMGKLKAANLPVRERPRRDWEQRDRKRRRK